MRTYSFEKLDVYIASLDFSVKIRGIVSAFPKEERYDLTQQMKRAADSLGTNIAEGSGRASNNDQAHFTNMAYGSGMEMIHHLNLARRMEYISEMIFTEVRLELDKIISQLNALYRYQVNNTETLKTKMKR